MSTLTSGAFYNIRNVKSLKMLNIYAGNADNGTNVCLWEEDNSIEQKWRLEGICAEGRALLHTMVNANMVLDFYTGSSAWANADIWESGDFENQYLTIEEVSENVWKIRQSSRCNVVLTAIEEENNSNVCWQEDRNSMGQLWTFEKIDSRLRDGLDTAAQCNLKTIREISNSPNKYQFACRYYCANQSSSKILTRNEAEEFSKYMDLVSVYQDANDRPEYFTYEIGYSDANNALNYAINTINQPENSAIYFAVDFNPNKDVINNNIIPYFKGIKAAFESKQALYRIGVYGSGLVCDVIKTMGLASYSWLAKSSGYWGTSEYNDPEKYSIRQGCVVKLNDVLFDSNSSGYAEDFWQWHFINR